MLVGRNATNIGENTLAIHVLDGRVGSSGSAIQCESGMIGELIDRLDLVRAGAAASMAPAGIPSINGRGITNGVASFNRESASAGVFRIQSEEASCQVGIIRSAWETGALLRARHGRA